MRASQKEEKQNVNDLWRNKMDLNPFGAAERLAGSVIDKLAPQTDNNRANQALEMTKTQTDTELSEARHPSTFVAGGRPFIIWICGFGIAYQYLLNPLFLWVWVSFGKTVATAPTTLDTSFLTSLVISLLGVGGMRMVEKLNGVETKRTEK